MVAIGCTFSSVDIAPKVAQRLELQLRRNRQATALHGVALDFLKRSHDLSRFFFYERGMGPHERTPRKGYNNGCVPCCAVPHELWRLGTKSRGGLSCLADKFGTIMDSCTLCQK